MKFLLLRSPRVSEQGSASEEAILKSQDKKCWGDEGRREKCGEKGVFKRDFFFK